MITVGYPSGDFPAPLPFAIDIPEDWLAVHYPGTLLAAYGPRSSADDLGPPSIMVRWRRAAITTDVATVARDELSRVVSSEDVIRLPIETRDSGGPFSASLFVYTSSRGDGSPTNHAVMYVLGPDIGNVRDLYSVVMTYSGDDDSDHQRARQSVLSFALATPNNQSPVTGRADGELPASSPSPASGGPAAPIEP